MNNNEAQNSTAKGQTFPNIPQQSIQISPELQQQITILNARINNLGLANNDLLQAIDTTFKTLLTKIDTLQKENTELKTKLTKNPEDPQIK